MIAREYPDCNHLYGEVCEENSRRSRKKKQEYVERRSAPLQRYLFLLHFRATALQRAVAAFGHDHLGTARTAEIHFPKLVGHTTIPPVSCLFSTELRRSLFEKRPHAFRSIVCRLQQGVQVFFQTDSLLERQVHRLLHCFFAKTQGDGAFP